MVDSIAAHAWDSALQPGGLASAADLPVAARQGPSFAETLGAFIDGTANAVAHADALAAGVAGGHGSIAEASIARAKADVLLELTAVTAARASGAITTLLQTQL